IEPALAKTTSILLLSTNNTSSPSQHQPHQQPAMPISNPFTISGTPASRPQIAILKSLETFTIESHSTSSHSYKSGMRAVLGRGPAILQDLESRNKVVKSGGGGNVGVGGSNGILGSINPIGGVGVTGGSSGGTWGIGSSVNGVAWRMGS
ncbi:hypothetical protein HDU76_010018, partial [Blyttiomyces sp. JEL0837]